MKSIKEIFNKEMVRVFKDKKMVFSVFFLPVIIMIGIMYLMRFPKVRGQMWRRRFGMEKPIF